MRKILLLCLLALLCSYWLQAGGFTDPWDLLVYHVLDRPEQVAIVGWGTPIGKMDINCSGQAVSTQCDIVVVAPQGNAAALHFADAPNKDTLPTLRYTITTWPDGSVTFTKQNQPGSGLTDLWIDPNGRIYFWRANPFIRTPNGTLCQLSVAQTGSVNCQ